MAGRKRGLITAGLRTCSTAPNIQKPHNNWPEIGAILARFYGRAMSFLSNGRDFGQALKTENLGRCATTWRRVLMPENPYSSAIQAWIRSESLSDRCSQPGSVALPRIVLMYVFGNSEDAGFAFKLNFAGRVCRQLDLPGFCAKAGHHIPDWRALIQPGKHESAISGIFPDPQLLHGASQEFIAGI